MYISGSAKTYNKSIESQRYKYGLYSSPALAAYAFGAKYNGMSIAKDREYGAVILEVNIKDNKMYTWQRVYKGTKSSVINMYLAAKARIGTEKILQYRKTKYCATVHTHSSCRNKSGTYASNGLMFFSPNDMKYLPKNRYLITPDGALHYAEGRPSTFISLHKRNKRPQNYYESQGWWYGEIIGYNLPHDPACGAYSENDCK